MPKVQAQKPQQYNYVGLSLVYTIFLTFSTFGYMWAVYALIGILSFVSAIVAISCAVYVNNDRMQIKQERRYSRNITLQFFSQTIFAICVYQVYAFGFPVLAGFFTFVVTIGYLSTFIALLMKGKE